MHSGNSEVPYKLKNPVSVMTWSSISADGIGRLNFIDGTLKNVNKYIDIVLEPKFPNSTKDLFPNNVSFIFQMDSIPCYSSKISKDWFCSKSPEFLSWLTNNLDLNPIQNMWHCLKKSYPNKAPTIEKKNNRGYYLFLVSCNYEEKTYNYHPLNEALMLSCNKK